MNLTDEQIKNWRAAFPFLVFASEELVKQIAAIAQARLNANLYNEHLRRDIVTRVKNEFFNVIRIGSKFTENGVEKVVTRVTDIVFDCMSTNADGESVIEVRNLGVLKDAKVQNTISILTL